jgi:hypothetical protein
MRYSETKALMRMLELRATWLDRWRAKRIPGHWLNELRRDLLILSDDDYNARDLLAKNREQAKMIAGYIDLIGAANDAGMHFWWEGRTARADWSQEARAIAIPLNLNQQVSVRFTEAGEAIWIAFHEGKIPESEMPDPQGWRRFQLWHLFPIFGKHIYLGCQVPFVENEIRLEMPKADTRWPHVCHLCNRNMESEADRAEWHGLGNCVPICPICFGSGSSEGVPNPEQLAEEMYSQPANVIRGPWLEVSQSIRDAWIEKADSALQALGITEAKKAPKDRS